MQDTIHAHTLASSWAEAGEPPQSPCTHWGEHTCCVQHLVWRPQVAFICTSLPGGHTSAPHSAAETQLHIICSGIKGGSFKFVMHWDWFSTRFQKKDLKKIMHAHLKLIKNATVFRSKMWIYGESSSKCRLCFHWLGEKRHTVEKRAKRKGGNGSGDMSHALLFVLHEAKGKLQSPNTQEAHQRAASHLPLTSSSSFSHSAPC